jgi:hypothetical protein
MFEIADCTGGDPRLQVALEIATEAHEGQTRDHGGPYIEHPKLVCHLAGKFGCNDVQKAVALLHDVREENKKKYPTSKALCDELTLRLSGLPYPEKELADWATQVCKGVDQLTNDPERFESKRTMQIDHIRKHLNKEFKPIKSLDQSASIFEDILYCDPRDSKAIDKALDFALKARAVSLASCGNDARYYPVHALNGLLYNTIKDIHDFAKQGNHDAIADIRRDFNLDNLIEASWHPKPRVKKDDMEVTTKYCSSSLSSLTQGVAYVEVSREKGNVTGYGVIVSPKKNESSPDNKLSSSLLKALEGIEREFIETGDRQKPVRVIRGSRPEEDDVKNGKNHIRYFALEHAIPLKQFLEVALKVKAVDDDFAQSIEAKLQLSQWASRMGGRKPGVDQRGVF